MTTTIKIKGMSCNHCVTAVAKALNQIDGIGDVRVDLDRGEATFEQEKYVEMSQIKREIEKAGYEIG